MWTGLEGNGAWPSALPDAMIAAAQTALRNQLLKHEMLKNELPKSLTSRFFFSYGTPVLRPPHRHTQITIRRGHVDNPAIRVKFRRLKQGDRR
jgi:hypothetical protein